jgi:hypothetical protein
LLVELVKPIALVMCLLSLCAVFNAAFLHPATGPDQEIWDVALLLSLSAGIAVSSGMIFRESTTDGIEPVTRTLPVRLFCWGVGAMVLLFLASWYLETHVIFYRDSRRL